jgi:hypothetical protein
VYRQGWGTPWPGGPSVPVVLSARGAAQIDAELGYGVRGYAQVLLGGPGERVPSADFPDGRERTPVPRRGQRAAPAAFSAAGGRRVALGVLMLGCVTSRSCGEPDVRPCRLSGMTTTRSIRSWLGRLVPAAVVVVTASCGGRVAGATVPAAPSPATPRPAAAAGVIFGVIRAGPTCPVDRVYHACRDRRLGNLDVQARPARTGVVFSARSNADGHFSVRLRPRNYLLTVLTTTTFPRCPQVPVSVRSGATVRARITCDTGIRLPAQAAGNSG